MIDCMVIGDSIAVGLHRERNECIMYAKGGWNTWQWNKDYLKNDLTADTVIISLGSNDYKGINTRVELEKMRAKVKGKRVFWILPAIKPHVQDIVIDLANSYGDTVLPIRGLQKDGVHPNLNGYKNLSIRTKQEK